MKKHTRYLIIVLAFCITIYGLNGCIEPSTNAKDSLKQTEDSLSMLVFGAASLTDVMTDIIYSFEQKHAVKIKISLASSGMLARQIEQGQLPDVYLSASSKWSHYIDSLGLVFENKQRTVAHNELVLIAPTNSLIDSLTIDTKLDIIHLLGDGRLSIGDPSHVPAGSYAKQALSFYDWYTDLEPKLLPTKDVRSALMVVELGECPLGIVYKTDALKSKKVKIVGVFPQRSHTDINLIASVCKNDSLAISFFEFLNSDEATKIWLKYGFTR